MRIYFDSYARLCASRQEKLIILKYFKYTFRQLAISKIHIEYNRARQAFQVVGWSSEIGCSTIEHIIKHAIILPFGKRRLQLKIGDKIITIKDYNRLYEIFISAEYWQ